MGRHLLYGIASEQARFARLIAYRASAEAAREHADRLLADPRRYGWARILVVEHPDPAHAPTMPLVDDLGTVH